MAIDLYLMEPSPPCRVVVMVAKHLGIDLNKKHLSLVKQEQLKPEFLKINPQHTVPTIDDDGFILWESRAIITYFVNKYAPDSELYPKDPQKRAVVDKLLYFDIGTLYRNLSECFFSEIFRGEKSEEKEKGLKNGLKLLDGFLEKSTYVAGNHLTLADFSLIAAVTFIEAMDISISEFPHIQSWLAKVIDELPYYKEVNEEGMQALKAYIEQKRQENKKE